MNDLNFMRQECWIQALHCFGTSYIFELRANLLRRRLRFLAFLGVAVPAAVGTAFTSWGAQSRLTWVFVALASVLGLIQLLGSIWSLANRWDDHFAYAGESLSSNRGLFEKYRALASSPPPTQQEAQLQLSLINVESQARSRLDEQQGITENEKRIGMRAALRQLQKACAACSQVPTTMSPSNCDVCGNFKIRRI